MIRQNQTAREMMCHIRQWPEVYDLCHTFLHVARVKKPTAMRESRAILACDSSMAVGFLNSVRFSHGSRFFDLSNMPKRTTKSDTSGHCLRHMEILVEHFRGLIFPSTQGQELLAEDWKLMAHFNLILWLEVVHKLLIQRHLNQDH